MLRLLLDENFNHHILRGLKLRAPHLDYVVAQAVGLKGLPDLQVLVWAAENGRMLVTHDLKTIPRYAYERVVAGEAMPGVIALSDSLPIGEAIEELATITECSEPDEWVNQVVNLPL